MNGIGACGIKCEEGLGRFFSNDATVNRISSLSTNGDTWIFFGRITLGLLLFLLPQDRSVYLIHQHSSSMPSCLCGMAASVALAQIYFFLSQVPSSKSAGEQSASKPTNRIVLDIHNDFTGTFVTTSLLAPLPANRGGFRDCGMGNCKKVSMRYHHSPEPQRQALSQHTSSRTLPSQLSRGLIASHIPPPWRHNKT